MNLLEICRLPRIGALFCALVCLGTAASAEFSNYDTATYDYLTFGAPKFVKTNYIDLNKVTQISKFRSFAGHDYSDQIEFGNAGAAIKIPGYGVEFCRSMKHYFRPPDDNTVIRAPVAGVISRIFEEEFGTQIHITSDVQPAFTFIIFHIVTPTPAVVGTHVDEGQVLGHHWGQSTDSDIAVAVHAPTGYHLISYFETLTDDLFAQFQARGIASRDEMIIPRDTFDAIWRSSGNPCAMFTNGANDDAQFVKMAGGAATQTLSIKSLLQTQYHVGDTLNAVATASSGLPVSIVSNAPKVCAAQGLTVNFRRPGTCLLQYVQDGDANTFPASSYQFYAAVAPAGAAFPGLPHLGAVFPPSVTGTQSFLRFISNFSGGTVTLTLTDATTGKDKITWTSPTIPAYSSPQFSISDIENAAPAGYRRPAMYGLRIESSTTLTIGHLQHVLYNPVSGTLTNLTTCDTGVGTPSLDYGNVHSSLLAGFPSSIAIHNPTKFDFLNVFLNPYDAMTGKYLSFGYALPNTMPSNSGAIVAVSDMEKNRKFTPTINHYMIDMSSAPYGAVFQHLVTSTQAGVITDMTTICNLSGGGMPAPGMPLRGGALFGTTQAASQSFLRFYNAGATAGPVNLTLYDSATGSGLGTWTSPTLPPTAELQMQIGDIETALGVTPRDNYEFRIDTDIDGYFQHVLWNSSGGALTNLSTCNSVGADPYALVGVHSSLLAAQGYSSEIVVINTGANAQTVPLGVYDARVGAKLGTYTTASIPSNGQAVLDVGAIETAVHVTPSGAMYHYIIKAETPFTGFLQHLVNNRGNATIIDMTAVCAM